MSKPELINVRCDCGTIHQIPRNEIGSTKYWLCGSCLDRESWAFEQRQRELIKRGQGR